MVYLFNAQYSMQRCNLPFFFYIKSTSAPYGELLGSIQLDSSHKVTFSTQLICVHPMDKSSFEGVVHFY